MHKEISVLLLWLICCIVCVKSFNNPCLSPFRLWSHFRLTKLADSSSPVDAQLQSFLQGGSNEPWRGSRDVLKRKKQWPLPEYSPQQVVRKVLDALQVNDDPQLDHGCCVLLEFKSPDGVLAQSGLDPAGYGRFLRSSDYSLLLDYNDAELVGDPTQGKDSLSLIQRVVVKGWTLDGRREERKFDFYLSFSSDMWLIDVILLVK